MGRRSILTWGSYTLNIKPKPYKGYMKMIEKFFAVEIYLIINLFFLTNAEKYDDRIYKRSKIVARYIHAFISCHKFELKM